jgi:hypothetical protein
MRRLIAASLEWRNAQRVERYSVNQPLARPTLAWNCSGHVVTAQRSIARYQCQVCVAVWQRLIASSAQEGDEDNWKRA